MGGGGSKNCWPSIYEKSLAETVKVHKQLLEMMQEGKIDPGDQKELTAFVQKHQADFLAKNKALYKKVWQQYDKNKDGLLSLQETQALTRDALTESKKFAKAIVRDLINLSIETAKIMMRKLAKDSGKTVSSIDLAEVDRRFEEVHSKAVEAQDRRIGELLSDYQRVGEALQRKMDPQGDGRVTQDKFLQHYARASNELLDPQAMLQEIFAHLDRIDQKEDL